MTNTGSGSTVAHTPLRVYGFLAVGIMAASVAAIFVRYAMNEGMPSSFIAAGRLTLSALILTPFALRHRAEIAGLTRTDLLLAAASGLILAIHFATWIASLEYTSVLVSVVLVGTSPLWSAILEVMFLHARLSRAVIIGLLVAFGGGILISLAEGSSTAPQNNTVFGAILSLVGAVTFAIYLVIGRRVRAKLPLVPYVWLVYGFAAIFLLILAIGSGVPFTGYSPNGYLMILLLALVPQLIGHTSFNYAVRFLTATVVGIATQVEPVSSALFAYLLFNEVPVPLQILGSTAILVGVGLAVLGQEKSD
jgi:drug/metabolite transporter (DMT)-like permease